jgi:hypothetical protein
MDSDHRKECEQRDTYELDVKEGERLRSAKGLNGGTTYFLIVEERDGLRSPRGLRMEEQRTS